MKHEFGNNTNTFYRFCCEPNSASYQPPNDDATLNKNSDGSYSPTHPWSRRSNQLSANVSEWQIPLEHGKKVVFVASDKAYASAVIARLAAGIGFAPVELGRIDEGGRLIQARSALVLRLFVEQPMFLTGSSR